MNRLLLLVVVASMSSCTSLATGLVADALSGTGTTLSSDEDPQLVADAAPFGLKTMESVLVEQPRHVGLLTALASGFTQYAYAFVQQPADFAELEGRSSEARRERERAKKLFLRARDYGLRGLEVRHPGISAKLRSIQDLQAAVAPLKKEDLPLVYWTAAAWALAISSGKEDMGLVAELPAPDALASRALELDESWNEGALHEFFVSFEAARPTGTEANVRRHFDRAVELARGQHLGVYLSLAEGVVVQNQNREEFLGLVNKVLEADPSTPKDSRLANTLAQQRARMLKQYVDDLFN